SPFNTRMIRASCETVPLLVKLTAIEPVSRTTAPAVSKAKTSAAGSVAVIGSVFATIGALLDDELDELDADGTAFPLVPGVALRSSTQATRTSRATAAPATPRMYFDFGMGSGFSRAHPGIDYFGRRRHGGDERQCVVDDGVGVAGGDARHRVTRQHE